MSGSATPWLLTLSLLAACVLLFAVALGSAWVLAGRRSALGFAGLALPLGWFAEQMGSSRGWFFGRYHYTDVLGPEIGNVPVAIALMWFALCWVGYSLACLLLWQRPVPAAPAGWMPRLLTAWLAAMIVTAFDLGADPYFVFVLKAWIMGKTDGGWFGETLQGFAGWMLVSFTIILLFQALLSPHQSPARAPRRDRRAALVPLGIYGSGLVFQLLFGHPIETRAVAFFAMGMPLFLAAVAWWQWAYPPTEAST
ncbi:MAG: carotenoid biosynthesis protein [Ramlibacter sp.]|nr:carotenoid biosynthesis protein [Ramlibacter sp.]